MSARMNLGTATVIRGNARRLPLADNSVDLVVSSPPYWSLRAYQDNGQTYDGQVGAEPTPTEFIDSLIEVTAECMRVLKPSGSIFVNLGDSYAGAPKAEPIIGRGQRERRTRVEQFTREDAAWLAGVIDSDGSIGIHVNKQADGRSPSFVPWVRIGQMRPEVVERAAEVCGTGRVMQDGRGVWHWSASAQQARWVLERIHPWLLIKKRQAWAAIEVARHVEERNAKGSWRQLTVDDVAYRQRLREAVKAWNQGEPDDCPVPDPGHVSLPIYPYAPRAKSLQDIPHAYALACVGELGLILRAEIILDKKNGLPESVTDRVRRSHEQVFHFVKEPRYFSAVDEIRQPHAARTIDQAGIDARAGLSASISGYRGAAGDSVRVRGHMPTPNPLGALPGSVWPYTSEPFQPPAHLGVDHFAAFATELPRRIILGWSPSGVCTGCGQGRRPVVGFDGPHDLAPVRVLHEWDLAEWARLFSAWRESSGLTRADMVPHFPHYKNADSIKAQFSNWERGKNVPQEFDWAILRRVLGEPPSRLDELVVQTELRPVRGGNFQASDGARKSGGTGAKQFHHKEPPARTVTNYACACVGPSAPTTPSVILDPFGGTGTTALVAKALGRHGITVDMSLDYGRLARWRTSDLDQLAKVQGIRRSDQARAADGLDMDTLFDFDGGAA